MICLPVVVEVIVFQYIVNKNNGDIVEFSGYYTDPNIRRKLILFQGRREV